MRERSKKRRRVETTGYRGRKYPIEPRFVIARKFDTAFGEHTMFDLVVCLKCEGHFTGKWHENGEPAYTGGWREYAMFDKDAPGGYHKAIADCPCPVGQAVGRPRITEENDVYPGNAAVLHFFQTGEDPRTFKDPREWRAVNEDDLDRWRHRWHIPAPGDPTEDDLKAAAAGEQKGLF